MMSQHDVRLKWPFRLLIAGSSGCGKSTLMAELAVSGMEVMSRRPSMIIVYHAHEQQTYAKVSSARTVQRGNAFH